MKLNCWLAYSDGMDGSYYVTIHNEKQEALERLDRTEEQLKEGDVYNDGYMEEIEIEIENGKLVKPIKFTIE